MTSWANPCILIGARPSCDLLTVSEETWLSECTHFSAYYTVLTTLTVLMPYQLHPKVI